MVKLHNMDAAVNAIKEITCSGGTRLIVEKGRKDGSPALTFRLPGKEKCVLHWGLSLKAQGAWRMPLERLRPEGSTPIGLTALQTPFTEQGGEGRLVIAYEEPADFPYVVFALYYPERPGHMRWDNNHGKNYHVRLPERVSPTAALRDRTEGSGVFSEQTFKISENESLACAAFKRGDMLGLTLATDIQGPVVLHWGAAITSPREWVLPPESARPEGTMALEGGAAETAFKPQDGLNILDLEFSKENAPLGIHFVLRQTERWINHRGGNFYMPLKSPQEGEAHRPLEDELRHMAEEVIRAETGTGSWSLMHRFNLCHDLLGHAGNSTDGLALLFVWLRFSAVRQLDWQRNYNTKPRELSHAQDRLTQRLAGLYTDRTTGHLERELLRLMMASLGRGGEGQRVRDEILNIMHRHRIREVSGTFLEEWHQKLHNNTTPDDPAICEAYLEFLQSDGDLDVFYDTLERAGVSRSRLEGFERPIVTPPDFVPHLKDALVNDFTEFLKTLRAVHSGTDLESALKVSGRLLGTELAGIMDDILAGREEPAAPLTELTGMITRARGMLSARISKERESANARDLIYLDLALEEFLRTAIEGNIHLHTPGDRLIELTAAVLDSVRLSYDNAELSACSRWWARLKEQERFSRDWSLHAKAATERLARAIGSYIDSHYSLLQPVAEHLGNALGAERWSINLFTEELVRGRLAFTLSQILRRLDPVLRKAADIGTWQVISPGKATGRVEVVDRLKSVEGKAFSVPTIIVAGRVKGDEAPPRGVAAVISPDTTDIVSHVAVRARNSGILFATCYDTDCFDRLKSLEGRVISLSVNTSGDVVFGETGGEPEATGTMETAAVRELAARAGFTAYAITESEFRPGVVGGKALNLAALREKLPDWIKAPSSAALPFGVFEHTLEADINRGVASRVTELAGQIKASPDETLSGLRGAILELDPPAELLPSLRRAMESSGLPWPEDPHRLWHAIKKVWASKWNMRAYLSREAMGIPHEAVVMSVLLQQVVEPDYAFVIHTANPVTKDRSELLAEIVPGLGETLVGNYPGRAMSFVSGKESPSPRLLSYPSKSTALRGGGLIFRSDSNAEDLAGFAGAGLYESVMSDEPLHATIDYTEEPIMWDEGLRGEVFVSLTRIGAIIEELTGSPQDIEGAYSKGLYYVVQSRPQAGI
jgi:alpha-glucan,water dikinase